MSPKAHIDRTHELAEAVFSNVLNGRETSRLDEYYAADCRFYGMTGAEAIDIEEYASFLEIYFEAFPDLIFELDEIVAEDGTVATRWTATGTHEGPLMDIAPTGESVSVSGMSFQHIEDGKITAVYSNQDMLGLLRQLDAIPDSPGKVVRLLVGQMRSRLSNR
ncbi:MAG: ester cyclase [Halobacteriota archaeon]|uniref:ester cyclase n=1 Tax=Natronomonas sp. TaxID=2184060 RepID=UPI0039758A5E